MKKVQITEMVSKGVRMSSAHWEALAELEKKERRGPGVLMMMAVEQLCEKHKIEIKKK